MTSFVPRPNYRVKPYVYLAEAGDTAEGIAMKFGRPARDYREIVATNVENRRLMPMPLGSPYGARTFAHLAEGERLKIPSHWPDVASALGDAGATPGQSVQIPDLILQGIAAMVQNADDASGGALKANGMLPAVTNAAVQWWTNERTTPASSPVEYVPYVQSAVGWVNTQGAALGPQAAAGFPWGPFLALLPAHVDPTTVNWATDTIPGSSNTPWISVPCAYLAGIGPNLEKIKPPPIPWGADTSPTAVLLAFKSVIDPALTALNVSSNVCGPNAARGADNACYCKPGYDWLTPTFDAKNPDSYACVPFAPGTPVSVVPNGRPASDVATPPVATVPPVTTTPPAPVTPTPPATNAVVAPAGTNPLLIGAAVVGGLAVVAGGVALAVAHKKATASGSSGARQANPVKPYVMSRAEREASNVLFYDIREGDRVTIVRFGGKHKGHAVRRVLLEGETAWLLDMRDKHNGAVRHTHGHATLHNILRVKPPKPKKRS